MRRPEPSAEGSWQGALSQAQQLPPLPAFDPIRRGRRALVSWSLVLFAGGALLILVAVSFFRGDPSHPLLSRSQELVGVSIAFTLWVVALVQLWMERRRLGAWDSGAMTAAAMLDSGQRRSLWRQIRGAEPVREDLLRLSVDVAAREVLGTARTYAALGLVVFEGSVFLADDMGQLDGLWFSALLIAIGVFFALRNRHAVRFLRAHGPKGA